MLHICNTTEERIAQGEKRSEKNSLANSSHLIAESTRESQACMVRRGEADGIAGACLLAFGSEPL